MEDNPYFALLITKGKQSEPQLIGLHFSLSMRYTNSAPYFCMAIKTVDNLANAALVHNKEAQGHTLKASA